MASGTATENESFSGYWRIGGVNLTSWPNRPTANYLAGSLDDAAVYDHALTTDEMVNHYALGVKDTTAASAPANLAASVADDDVTRTGMRPPTTSGSPATGSTAEAVRASTPTAAH